MEELDLVEEEQTGAEGNADSSVCGGGAVPAGDRTR